MHRPTWCMHCRGFGCHLIEHVVSVYFLHFLFCDPCGGGPYACRWCMLKTGYSDSFVVGIGALLVWWDYLTCFRYVEFISHLTYTYIYVSWIYIHIYIVYFYYISHGISHKDISSVCMSVYIYIYMYTYIYIFIYVVANVAVRCWSARFVCLCVFFLYCERSCVVNIVSSCRYSFACLDYTWAQFEQAASILIIGQCKQILSPVLFPDKYKQPIWSMIQTMMHLSFWCEMQSVWHSTRVYVCSL